MRILWLRLRMFVDRLKWSVQRGVEGRGQQTTDRISFLRTLPQRAGYRIRDLFAWLVNSLVEGHRSLPDLLLGLPAVLVMLGLLGATFWGHKVQQAGQLVYWGQGQQALREGDAAAARLYLSKALSVSAVNRGDITLQLAQAADMQGDVQTARALMASLASPGVAGHPRAHRYLAVKIADSIPNDPSRGFLETWHWHLTHADQVDEGPFQRSWGLYCMLVGDFEEATQHLRRAAQKDPVVWLQVAELEARSNNVRAAEGALREAAEFFQGEFQRAPEDRKTRFLYATTLFYMGALDQARALLLDGLRDDEESEQFRQLLGAVLIRKFDAEVAKREGQVDGETLGLLSESLRYAPQNQAALRRLIDVAYVSESNLHLAREETRAILASGNASAMAHFVLGSLEWMAGNQKLAELSIEHAMALDPQLGEVANNMAYLICQDDDGDLEIALELANRALETSPDHAAFLDTRACVYMRMQRWNEAAVDYLKALPNTKNPAAVRAGLAKAYAALGDDATAAQFRLPNSGSK